MARPTDYSKEIADFICEQIAEGESLRAIVRDHDHLPAQSTIFVWLSKHVEFAEQYARAREAAAHSLIAEAREIVDDGSNDWMEKHHRDNVGWTINGEAVARSRLRAEQRRWEAEKLNPKVYSPRQMIEHSGSITLKDASDDELMAEMLELLTTGRLKLPGGIQIVEVEDEPEAPEPEEDDFSDIA